MTAFYRFVICRWRHYCYSAAKVPDGNGEQNMFTHNTQRSGLSLLNDGFAPSGSVCGTFCSSRGLIRLSVCPSCLLQQTVPCEAGHPGRRVPSRDGGDSTDIPGRWSLPVPSGCTCIRASTLFTWVLLGSLTWI